MLNRVDIIITTKNRLNDLLITIDYMISIGFSEKQFYIIDDGSTDETFSTVKALYKEINIKRNEYSKGLMVNRSELMLWTANDFILSIDDDSYIRSKEDIVDAIKIMDSDASYGIFHFRVYNQIAPPPSRDSFVPYFQFLRGYIGCGHLIKRELIKKLGRYREKLVFYCEELDYSLRAYKLGYKTVTRDDLIVHHRIDMLQRVQQKSTVDSKGIYGREWRNIHLYSNNIIITMLYYPIGLDLLFCVYRMILSFYIMVLKEHQLVGYFKMIYRLFKFIPYTIKESNKLSYSDFFEWFRYSDMTDSNSVQKV